MSAAGIQSRGLAKGDLKLGHYASLRNEVGSLGSSESCPVADFDVVILDIQAFVFDPSTGLYIYPPNASGWTLASSFRGLIQFGLDALSD